MRLAREFGFCYGVERAVEYAYQTRMKFPERRIFLAGEIIHNPHVNAKIAAMGIVILSADAGGFDYSAGPPRRRGHPAGVRRDDRRLRAAARTRLRDGGHDVRLGAQRLEARRELCARRVHRADPRQVLPRGDARDGVAGDEVPARALPRRARPRRGAGRLRLHRGAAGTAMRSASSSRTRRVRGSIPTSTSRRIGVANQTTMLARESLAVGELVGAAMEARFGARIPGGAVPHLRHDLQRDAGPAGRGARAAARAARR